MKDRTDNEAEQTLMAEKNARSWADDFETRIADCQTRSDLKKLITSQKYKIFLEQTRKRFPEIAEEVMKLSADVSHAFQSRRKL